MQDRLHTAHCTGLSLCRCGGRHLFNQDPKQSVLLASSSTPHIHPLLPPLNIWMDVACQAVPACYGWSDNCTPDIRPTYSRPPMCMHAGATYVLQSSLNVLYRVSHACTLRVCARMQAQRTYKCMFPYIASAAVHTVRAVIMYAMHPCLSHMLL